MESNDAEILSALRHISEQIAILFQPVPPPTPASGGYSDGKLVEIACAIYGARMERVRCFDMELFGEPAWDMLLDLFINTAKGQRLGTTSLCLGSNAPQSTALRYIEALEVEGLLRRYRPVDDRRLNCVEMTARGKKLMRDYLSGLLSRIEARDGRA